MKRKRQPTEAKSKILFVPEVTKILGYDTDRAVWNMIHRNQLPHRKWGGRIIVIASKLDAFIDALPGVTLSDALTKAQEEHA